MSSKHETGLRINPSATAVEVEGKDRRWGATPLSEPRPTFGPNAPESRGAESYPWTGPLEIRAVRPAGDTAQDFNRAVEAAFAEGSESVLVSRPGITWGADALKAMRSAATHVPHGAVLTAIVTLSGSRGAANGVCRFRGAYFWSATTLRWDREEGYCYFGSRAHPMIETANCLAADVLLIPRSAWTRVGPFDERFGTYLADLDWVWRAAQCGVSCLQVPSAEFAGENAHAGRAADVQPAEIASIFLFARKHWPLRRWFALFAKRLWRTVSPLEDRRRNMIHFWADYGTRVDIARRTVWYMANLFGSPLIQIRQELMAAFRTVRLR